MSSRNCPYSIRRVQKTCRKYMAMSSRRETRATEQKQKEEKENPPKIALASERFLARSAPRVIDLSRARRRTHGTPRTSRTSRDAYAKRDNAKTSNSELEFPVGEPSVYTPNLRQVVSHLSWGQQKTTQFVTRLSLGQKKRSNLCNV